MFDDVNRRIEGRQFLRCRVQLLAPDVFGGVDDLALQIARVHHVEVHQAQRANTCRGQVKGQGRTEPARPDTEYPRGLQLPLALHAHLGQNQVPRVAREIVSGQLRQRVGVGFGGCFHLVSGESRA